jgi:lipopolysaccharide transport system ATP-binding protein
MRGGTLRSYKETEEFWALRDLNFELKRGEVVGVIGRNGAGKSTLLKILSRITEPSLGRIKLKGRIASLLEVGTGFHPELTGRENILLNGAIMGMTRSQIRQKFDEIVAFAEVEKFLETPVKRYSSGMYVRLAFAVAAHLDPEILVIDEVLAVGDVEFQKKCLAKISEVANAERTVLFVSHNMEVVQQLCQRAILLKEGRLIEDAEPREVIQSYLSVEAGARRVDLDSWVDRDTTGEARIIAIEFTRDASGMAIPFGEELRIRIYFRMATQISNPVFGLVIHDSSGVPISDLCSRDDGLVCGTISGAGWVELSLPSVTLYPGRYLVSPWICDSALNRALDLPKLCSSFEVLPGKSQHGDLKMRARWGKVFFPTRWSIGRAA